MFIFSRLGMNLGEFMVCIDVFIGLFDLLVFKILVSCLGFYGYVLMIVIYVVLEDVLCVEEGLFYFVLWCMEEVGWFKV